MEVIIVSENKTLGRGDDGNIQCVEALVTITLPHENTWKFVSGDNFIITSGTDSTVTIDGESGVTLFPISNITITNKADTIHIIYDGNNKYQYDPQWVILKQLTK